ncbi:MAG TPA: alanyl-tRNA editing protein [Gemmatimonadales bacterium]|nr:alanyl-tRNA editing protein [Gemmatimonadales bacterium]
MTQRLYYTDARLTTFDARVTGRSDDSRRIQLDRTAFYPTSGGQPHDTGVLGGARVIDVVEEDDVIVHVLAQPAPLDGVVTGAVDWPRRFDHMQQHTGQHLLSGLLHDLAHAPTTSVHFGPESSTVDVAVTGVPERTLEAIEDRANEIIAERRPVIVSFEEAATIEGLRKASARTGTLRIITIQDADRSACGGTHVADTGEIGALAVRRVEKMKQGVRIEFLCGHRVLTRARRDAGIVAQVGTLLSAGPSDIIAGVTALKDGARSGASALKRLQADLARAHAREAYAATAPAADGTRLISAPAGLDLDALVALGQAVSELAAARFVGALDEPPTLFIAAATDAGWNAGALIKDLIAKIGGKGGGSPRQAQASMPDGSALARALGLLVASIRDT